MLPLRARVDLGAIAIKGYSTFPKYPASGTSPSDCFVSYPGQSLGGSYPSAEVLSVYSTAPADWANDSSAKHLHPNTSVLMKIVFNA